MDLISTAQTGDGEAFREQSESISLAFVTALQVLPSRQLAVLILRDVLGYHASEVAGMLDSTVESVTSALKRARASMQRGRAPAAGREPPPASGSKADEAIVARFVRAWESADLSPEPIASLTWPVARWRRAVRGGRFAGSG